MQKNIANGMGQYIKPLRIASFNSIYPKMFTSISVRGIHLINKSSFSVTGKTIVACYLEGSKKACLFMIFSPLKFSDSYFYKYSTCMWIRY